ncbi:SDR family NAD(P)-dependent oxidoreductase [Flavisphingomonas formosensis]|uniref:SDR family NAD(P)-dependent oxidoreductase n=1 Tax=Flavisphingomonas formosensis TaxID=861534 RepID=UPI001E52DF58|nr:SDR family oxidoreductase [Sphingomonas formosensis]
MIDCGGRVALVTGAGQGIGRAIALSLARCGASGIAVNDFHARRAAAVAAEIEAAGIRAIAVTADVTDSGAVEAMMAQVGATLGRIGILINNAGNAGPLARPEPGDRPFWELPADDWQRWFAVNLFGVMHCCRAAIPQMIARGGDGRIVTILSEAGRMGEPRLEAYSGAKAGAAGFLRALARSVGRHGITVNMVSLGATMTPTSAEAFADDAFREKILNSYVIRRLGTPDDAAAMACFLASDAAGWITGQTIAVNGGYSFTL